MSTAVAAAKSTSTSDSVRAHGAFSAAWILLAGCAVVMFWVLWHVWMSLPEMNDRFLIPLAAGWLVHRNWPRWNAIAAVPSRWGLSLVSIGAALAPPAWFLFVQVGPRTLLLWWLMASLAFTAFGLCVAQFGWRRAWVNAFPLAFCFLSLPVPERLQAPLQMRLKEYTTSATAAALPAIGIPAERRGHTLLLPSGQLGVVDACSGVRSVTALTAIALFVAYVRGFSMLRSALLVALTLGIVVVSNSLRVIVTGVLQEKLGPQFAQGWAHSALGYSVILIGLVLIVGTSSLLARGVPSREYTGIPAAPRVQARGGFFALALIVASVGGCWWAEQFRVPEGALVNLAKLPMSIAGWSGSDRPVPEGVTDMLKADQIVHRIYVSELGHEVAVYVMYWAPASTAAMHHPDVCMPLQGWDTASSQTWPIEYETGRAPVPVSLRTYTQSSYRQLVFYWAQVGNTVLPDGKEDAGTAQAHRWVIDMLTGKMGPPQTARLSVRVDMELIGDENRQAKVMSEITAALAREIYAQLPWAAPEK